MSDEPQQHGWAPRDPSAPHAAPGRPAGKAGRPVRPRTGWRSALPSRRTLFGGLLIFGLVLMGGFVLGYKLVSIPPANAAATAQSNVYLYADGTHLARDGEVNRENVKLAQVPKTVQLAVLAAEDRGFYNEPAIDPQGMVRAAWNTVTGKGTQGGSTITQQYVKNYYLGQEQTIVRKAKEFFIAIKLNREATKGQILRGYLNTSYFGRNAYGVQAAAQAYYGKDVEEINTAEGAYLASLLNAPSEFDVVFHPENKRAAVARWKYVLDGMVKEDWLSPAERRKMKFPMPGKIRHAGSGLSGQRGYIVQAVEEHLTSNRIIDEKTLAAGGYRITTTLDRAKQEAFTTAVEQQVTSQLKAGRKADRVVRVGGVSIEPKTGKVVAMYGGIDYTKQYVNNATRRDYQVGSTFKPFVFAAAVENGSETLYGEPITPYTVYDGDNQHVVEGPDGPTDYSPANEDDTNYGPISVQTATDYSVNAVYAQMAQDVGPDTVRKTAVALGLPENTPDLTATPSIALGPATASVLDMAKAYATLANHGRHGMYTLVDRITRNGTEVTLPKQDMKQVISRLAADTTTSVLRGVVAQGTGTAAQSAGRPAAGKTGTAEEDKAAWFAGYTPDLATVVAVMGADPVTAAQKSLYGALGRERINGGGPPTEIWGRYTAAALRKSPAHDFDLRLDDDSDSEEDSSSESEQAGPPGKPKGSHPAGAPSAAPGGAPGQSPGQTDRAQDGSETDDANGSRAQGRSQGSEQGRVQGQSAGRTPGQPPPERSDGGGVPTGGGGMGGASAKGSTGTGGGGRGDAGDGQGARTSLSDAPGA
ncbi:transglycosylase domain-containing protein [Streptomyces sp. 35G-GA-8]|uniref:transglycosylase domain-containing protein n=1 Tax=Streptomyces sp. 35G-GA-8 TaxID=2939434 RepID=UPI00201F5B57|nr:transglycosylase domain-containing protein [Streptomyces sp. 35G-GA-8]MCL7381406.1 transglycosylase domain-containing protein [Streptomyces sp. 35G-GA-8]